ncbi:hypothetical protein MRX96_021261 [Rhipicephalus microplus]
MKVFIFLVLLAVTTSFDAAIIQEAGGIEGEKFAKDFKPAVLKKAGKSVETLGRILQGDLSFKSAEERVSVLDALKYLTMTSEARERLRRILYYAYCESNRYRTRYWITVSWSKARRAKEPGQARRLIKLI